MFRAGGWAFLGFGPRRAISKFQTAPLVEESAALRLEASKSGIKVGRMKDPLHRDPYLGLPHLPSSYLLGPPIRVLIDVSERFGFGVLKCCRSCQA